MAISIEDVLSTFRYNLVLLRTSYSLTAEELSELLFITKKRISDIEERTPPKLEDIILIANYFNISFDNLLSKKIKLDFNDRRSTTGITS